jgi:hypothetical protein
VAYAPVYYPGTITLGSASPVTVGVGEERSGVDFQIDLVQTARVTGVVTRADGQPPAGVQVRLTWTAGSPTPVMAVSANTATTGADGGFVFDSVIPGEYVVEALSGVTSSRVVNVGIGNNDVYQMQSASAVTSRMSARQALLVTGTEVSGVTLTLRPGASLSGRVVFKGAAPTTPVGRGSVALTLVGDLSQIWRGAGNSPISAKDTFGFSGLTPGRYLMSVNTPPGPTGTRWTAASIVVNGREVIDRGLEITGDEGTLDAVVTMTDHVGELSGVFQDASGRPLAGHTIVLFGTERASWTWQSRRIKAARPASDGRFAFSEMPPGEYFLTAVTDVETNEWFDARFLEQLVPAAIKVTIADGEKKVQDIRIR